MVYKCSVVYGDEFLSSADSEPQLQWTLTYPDPEYLAARIIRTAHPFSNYNAHVLHVYAKMASSSCSASCSRKRKRTVVSLETKLGILDRLKKGEIQAQLASEYGVGKSTVADIKKNEEKIRNFATTMDSLAMSKKRKVMRLADNDKLDQAPLPLVRAETKPKLTSKRSHFVRESCDYARTDPRGRVCAAFSR